MCISELIKKHAEEIGKFRKLLFPLIGFDLITGLNIYEEGSRFSNFPIILNHLHSELNEGRIYRKTIEERIKKCCDTYHVQKIHYEKVDRHTAYRLREGWPADEYYDTTGRAISAEEAEEILTQGETVVGGGMQNSLQIALENPKTLESLLEEFRCHFNSFEIDKETGLAILGNNGKPKPNADAVIGAWEVPVFTIKSAESRELGKAYPEILEVMIKKPDYFIDIFIDKKRDYFIKFLNKINLEYSKNKSYANRIFVDYLNETINPDKFQTFVKNI